MRSPPRSPLGGAAYYGGGLPREFQRDRDDDPFADALGAAGNVLGNVLHAATGALGGVTAGLLGGTPFAGGFHSALKGKMCCCTNEGVDVGRMDETQDSAPVSSFVYGEEAEQLAVAVFPTILKQKENSKPPTPTSRTQSPSGTMPWSPAPGGVLASLMTAASASGNDELVEWQEVEIEGGARYTGQWLGEERHGRGVLVGMDGVTYEGQFRHSRAHGRGVFIEEDGSRYEGQWDQDLKHGHGIYIHSDQTTYEGQWRQDAKSGTGTETWADGAMYQGEFLNGFKHGVGIYRGGSGTEYEGQFREDKMDGEGCYKFVGGRKYFGQWADGHMSGLGRMEWPNGSVYEGGYENDLKSGEGSFTWPDGRRYSGQWVNGKQDGTGISEDGKGFRSQDIWKGGELVSTEKMPDEVEGSEDFDEDEA